MFGKEKDKMDPEVLNEKSRYFPKLSVTTINPLREEDSGPKAHSHKNSNKKVIFTKAKGSVGLGPMCEKKKMLWVKMRLI